MSDINITIPGGTSKRLLTSGKYCDSDIVVTAEGGGNGFTFNDIATRNVSGDAVLSVESIAAYSFYGCTGITSLKAPYVTQVGGYAFYAASGLSGDLDLPLCTSIGDYAFCQCRNIGSLSIPNVKTLGQYAFQQCYKIPTLDAPNLVTMGTGAFGGSATYKMAFKSIHLPKCTAIPNSALTYCANVTELVLPECTSVGNSSLTNWTNLAYVDLPKCKSIVNYGLRNNSKLETLILRSETMCALSNYALNSTKIWNGTGRVFVPKASIPSYQVANNWKIIYGKNANAFCALEDYTVDGTITGALDESKI